jgi:hypothetical protein
MDDIGKGKDELLYSMTNIMAAVEEIVAIAGNVTNTISSQRILPINYWRNQKDYLKYQHIKNKYSTFHSIVDSKYIKVR